MLVQLGRLAASPARLPPRAAASTPAAALSPFCEGEGQYLEVVITARQASAHGAVLALRATAASPLPPPASAFPLCLSAAAAAALTATTAGLPPSLAALEDAHTKDVRLFYVDSCTPGPASGSFLVLDLVTGVASRVPACCSEVLSLALAHGEPVRLATRALVAATAAGLCASGAPAGEAAAGRWLAMAAAGRVEAELPELLAQLAALQEAQPELFR